MQKIIKFNMIKIKISNAKLNKNYIIDDVKIKDENLKNQLQNLGFLKDEKILILKTNLNSSAFLVEVMGVLYAVDKKICDNIFLRNVV